jgi:hypothetical protein
VCGSFRGRFHHKGHEGTQRKTFTAKAAKERKGKPIVDCLVR